MDERQLFGWANQLIGALSAAALFTPAISGFLMWRKRKPNNQLGAPVPSREASKLNVIAAIVLMLAALRPLLAASVIMLWLAVWKLSRPTP